MARKRKRKRPQKAISPSSAKVPRQELQQRRVTDKYFVWDINGLDLNGDWGWEHLESSDFCNLIYPRISSFESMTWGEILSGRSNHPVNVSDIAPQAQTRLLQINRDDVDQIIQLRIAYGKRVWGQKVGNIFNVLWWDPRHSVYPSDTP